MSSKTQPTPPVKSHACESLREGDWIIYHCSRCNYQLRENLSSGEIVVRNAKAKIRHFGTYFPIGFKEAFSNQN
jgi:hypothetical protein